MQEDWNEKTEQECTELLHKIFADKDEFQNSIAPDGWVNSDSILFFHPTPEQQREEHNRFSENLAWLTTNKNKTEDVEPPKTLSDFQMDNLENINVHNEFIQILGEAIWDIFSDNHEVIAEDGKIFDLGSFRGSGTTISESINENYPLSSGSLEYMDFYMGSVWINGRASMLPFYKYIFTVLKQNNCDWRYSFPRMGLVSFKKEDLDNDNPAEYDPLKAVQKELSGEKSEVDNLQKELDKIYDQEYEEAKYKPLPVNVKAYQEVYGILPEGHPQKEFDKVFIPPQKQLHLSIWHFKIASVHHMTTIKSKIGFRRLAILFAYTCFVFAGIWLTRISIIIILLICFRQVIF